MSTAIQRSFAGGEIAPQLYGRADQAKYATGLRTCRNFVVQRFGGVANRAGLRFVCEVKDSTKKVELIPFEVADNVGRNHLLLHPGEHRQHSAQRDLLVSADRRHLRDPDAIR